MFLNAWSMNNEKNNWLKKLSDTFPNGFVGRKHESLERKLFRKSCRT